jgi:hypothetical protein
MARSWTLPPSPQGYAQGAGQPERLRLRRSTTVTLRTLTSQPVLTTLLGPIPLLVRS